MSPRGLAQVFGPFVEPPGPMDRPRRDATQASPPGELVLAPREPDLHLEVGEGTDLAPRRSRLCETLACSITAHAAGLMALVAVPLLLSSALPQPADGVRVFFVDPIVAPPPPPPPPPVPVARASATKLPAPSPEAGDRGFFAPVEIPSELRPEEWQDLGIEGGSAGGVVGGVPGGVVGGIVAGLPDPPPQPAPVEPLRVGVHVKRPVKVKHISPLYPEVAANARLHGIVIIEAVIDESGHIARTTLLRGMPLLSEAALEAVKHWVYTPTLLNGVPIAIKMTITVSFELKKASGPSLG